jgi:hypothetical protein
MNKSKTHQNRLFLIVGLMLILSSIFIFENSRGSTQKGCCIVDSECKFEVEQNNCNSENQNGVNILYDPSCSNSLCGNGCCVKDNECIPNIDYLSCTSNNGRYTSCDVSECKIGCCVFVNQEGENECRYEESLKKNACLEIYKDQGVNFFEDISIEDCVLKCQKDVSFSGNVFYNSANGELPLPGANIKLEKDGLFYEAVSQDNGYFIIQDDSGNTLIESGSYELTISKTGYDSFTEVVNIKEDYNKEYLLTYSTIDYSKFGSVIGQVIDAESKDTESEQAVSNVIVFIPSQGNFVEKRTMTDNEGKFILESVPVGKYTLYVSKEGYSSLAINNVDVIETNAANLDKIYLSKKIISGESRECDFGCKNTADYIGMNEDGKYKCRTLSENNNPCIEPADHCCFSKDYCSNIIEEKNVCSVTGTIGCRNPCDKFKPCAQGELIDNVNVDYCLCGNKIYSTSLSGSCCRTSTSQTTENTNMIFRKNGCGEFLTANIDGLKIINIYDESAILGARLVVSLKEAKTNFLSGRTGFINGETYKYLKDENNQIPQITCLFSKEGYQDSVIDCRIDFDSKKIVFEETNNNNEKKDINVIKLLPVETNCYENNVDDNKDWMNVPNFNAHINEVGSSDIKLTWNYLSCNKLQKFEIFRAMDLSEDSDLNSNYQRIAVLPADSFYYLDTDTDFEHIYSYIIIPYYEGGEKPSYVESLNIYSGDLRCKGRNQKLSNQEFCSNIDEHKENQETTSVYRLKCDENNVVVQTNDIDNTIEKGTYKCNENGNLVCVGPNKNGETLCKQISSCSVQNQEATPFGLFYSKSNCYGIDDSNNVIRNQNNVVGERYKPYCVYDKGDGLLSECKDCTTYDSCYDYKSKDACEIDNCIVSKGSTCVWIASNGKSSIFSLVEESVNFILPQSIGLGFGLFGEGLCVPSKENKLQQNCELCSNSNSPFNNNLGCTQEICDLLGDCYSNGDSCLSCNDEITCNDYTSKQMCEGNTEGVEINSPVIEGKKQGYEFFFDLNYPADKNIILDCSLYGTVVKYSDNACELKVCNWNEQNNICIKDGNGDLVEDCTDEVCRKSNIIPKLNIYGLSDLNTKATFNLKKNIVLDSNVALSLDNGFAYCIDKDNKCCPFIEKQPGSSKMNVTLSPRIDYKTDSDGNSYFDLDVYSGEGLYYLRYIAMSEHKNVAELTSIPIYLDLTSPKLKDENSFIYEKNEETPKASILNINFELNENAYCYDVLITEKGDFISNIGDYETKEYDSVYSKEFEVSYQNLDDGNYKYKVVCKDEAQNENKEVISKDIFIDAYTNISIVSPNRAIRSLNPIFEINTSDEAESCFLIYENDGSIIRDQFKAIVVSEDESYLENKLFRITDLSKFPVLEENTQYINSEYRVKCNFLKSKIQNRERSFSFVTDYTEPITSFYVQSNNILEKTLKSDEDVVDSNSDTRIYLECDDSKLFKNGKDISSEFTFGCDEILYCISYDTQSCNPNSVYDNDDGFTIKQSGTIYYNSVDKGDNQKDYSQKVYVKIDKFSPIITIDEPILKNNLDSENYYYVGDKDVISFVGSIEENVLLKSFYYGMDADNLIEETFSCDSSLNENENKVCYFSGSQIIDETKSGLYPVIFRAIDHVDNYDEFVLNYYYDKIGPNISNIKINDESITDLSKAVNIEYGDDFEVSFDLEDTQWTKELSFVSVDFKYQEGFGELFDNSEFSYVYDENGDSDYLEKYSFDKLYDVKRDYETNLYNYKPGKYVLDIVAKDSLNNEVEYNILININDTQAPTLNRLNSEYTNLNRGSKHIFSTDEPAKCYLIYNTKKYEMESDKQNKIHEITFDTYLRDGTHPISVTCQELYGYNIISGEFNIIVDSVSPSVKLSVSKGVKNDNTQKMYSEYLLDSYNTENNLLNPIVTITEENGEEITCNYECNGVDFGCPNSIGEKGSFSKRTNSVLEKTFNFKKDSGNSKGDYRILISCSDKAGNIARLNDLFFRVNGFVDFDVNDLTLSNSDNEKFLSIDSDSIELSVKTNQLSECNLELDNNVYDLNFDSDLSGFVHRLNISKDKFTKISSDTDNGNSYQIVYDVNCVDLTSNNVVSFSNGKHDVVKDEIAPVLSNDGFDSEGLPAFKIESDSDTLGYYYAISSSNSIEPSLSESNLFLKSSTDDWFVYSDIASSNVQNGFVNIIPVDKLANKGSLFSNQINQKYQELDFIPSIDLPNYDGIYYISDSDLVLSGVFPNLDRDSVSYKNIQTQEKVGFVSLNDDNSINKEITKLSNGRNDIFLYYKENDIIYYHHILIVKDTISPKISLLNNIFTNKDSVIELLTDEDSFCSITYEYDGSFVSEILDSKSEMYFTKVLNDKFNFGTTNLGNIKISCNDKAGNVESIDYMIKIDLVNPTIKSLSVNGFYDDSKYIFVKNNYVYMEANADEPVKCKYDFENKEFESMDYYSDDFNIYALHPRISFKMNDGEEKAVFVKCIDESGKISNSIFANVKVDLSYPTIIFDSYPSGTINDRTPSIGFKTFRDSECSIESISKSDNIFIAFLQSIRNTFLSKVEVQPQLIGDGTYLYETKLSSVNTINIEKLKSDTDFEFKVICKNKEKPELESAESIIKFKTVYVDEILNKPKIVIVG